MTGLTKYEKICHPLYFIVSGGLNVPPVVFGVLGLVDWCNLYSNWLAGNAALTGLNAIAAIYCVYKIRKVSRPRAANQNNGDVEEAVEKDGSDTDSNSNRDNTEIPSPPRATTPMTRSSSGCFSRLVHLRTISSDRIRHLVCYDGIITTYAIMFLFWVFWLSEGTQRLRQGSSVPSDQLEGCLAYHDRYMRTSLVCGYTYFAFVTIASLASLCYR